MKAPTATAAKTTVRYTMRQVEQAHRHQAVAACGAAASDAPRDRWKSRCTS